MGSGYICKLSKKVERKSVEFKNRYGLSVVGDFYTDKKFK